MTGPAARRILVSCSPGELRIAAVADRLVEYSLWRPGRPDGVGDVHCARIAARARALGGSFVVLEGEALHGFLPDSEGGGAAEGSRLLVRVTRAAQHGKGPRVSARVEQPTDPALLAQTRRLERGPDPVRRMAALHPEARLDVDDAHVLAGLDAGLRARAALVARSFDPATEDEVAGLAQPVLALPGGGRMTIESLAALTAIDVDGGTMGREAARIAHRRINLAMLPELVRQMRLRNLSGAILVDFAGLSTRERAGLEAPLRAALAEDRLAPRLVGFTGLGLAEISRRRVHAPLAEQLAGAHAAAAAALRHAVSARPARGGQSEVLLMAPDVHAAFIDDGCMRRGLERSAAAGLGVRASGRLEAGQWRMGDAGGLDA